MEDYISLNTGTQARGYQDKDVEVQLKAIALNIRKERDMSFVIPQLENMYNTKETNINYLQHSNEIAWYLSLAYIKNGQIDEAVIILQKLVHDNEGLPIAEKAKLLIERIK